MNKKLLVLVAVLLFLSGCSFETQNPSSRSVSDGVLNVHFIDVGQADSILVYTASAAMLIDGGNNEDSDKVVNYIKAQGITRLDYVVGTHPHEDHIGGLDAVVKKFDIGKIYMPKVQTNTKTFKSLLTEIKNKGLKVTSAKAGMKFDLDQKAKCEILSPSSDSYEEMNDYSVVIKLTYGSKSFLFEGDAETLPESEMLKNYADLKADVLKVAHHGSSTSTSDEFLAAVAPEYAVISVGKSNSYNHPNKQTLKKLKNIKLYRTDKDGTVIMTTDGSEITVEKEKQK